MTTSLLSNPEIMSTMSQLFQEHLAVLLDGLPSLVSVGVYRTPPPNSLGTESVSSATAWPDRNPEHQFSFLFLFLHQLSHLVARTSY